MIINTGTIANVEVHFANFAERFRSLLGKIVL